MTIKILASNRKAFHEYIIGDKFEAGMALVGTEVKSLRQGKANLSEGWVDVRENKAILQDVHIGHYVEGNQFNHLEARPRNLLLNPRELAKLQKGTQEKGMTIVVTKVYLKGRWIKVEIALAKGKKHYDKREASKTRDAKKSMDRAMKSNR